MAKSAARTVPEYLEALPPERRAVVAKVRSLVRKHLPRGYEEAMDWGMICWQIPLARYPETYNGHALGYVALGARKDCFGLYLFGPYMDEGIDAALRGAYKAAGRKLDMGKSCLTFRDYDDLHAEAIAATVAALPVEDYLRLYEKSRPPKKKAGGAKKASTAKKKPGTKKPEKKK